MTHLIIERFLVLNDLHSHMLLGDGIVGFDDLSERTLPDGRHNHVSEMVEIRYCHISGVISSIITVLSFIGDKMRTASLSVFLKKS